MARNRSEKLTSGRMADYDIVHAFHRSRAPLVREKLTIGGAGGHGPSRLGLWACPEENEWQRSYGAFLNKLNIHPDARAITMTSKTMTDIVQGNLKARILGHAAWDEISQTLINAGYQVILIVQPSDITCAQDMQTTEIIILDPSVVISIETQSQKEIS